MRVTVEWKTSQNSADDISRIQSSLELGLDEGPILMIEDSRLLRKPLIFSDFARFAAHLASRENDDSTDLWLGVARTYANVDEAIAALTVLARVYLAEPRIGRRRPRRKGGGMKGKRRAADAQPDPYMSAPYRKPERTLLIENMWAGDVERGDAPRLPTLVMFDASFDSIRLFEESGTTDEEPIAFRLPGQDGASTGMADS